jgi:beta-lactam-binding protein with PASTA domain
LAIFTLAGCSSKVEMPALEGMDVKSATARLIECGLVVGPVDRQFSGMKGSGTVLRQSPSPATRVSKGAMVHLIVEESVDMPNLVGLDMASATRAMELRGLRLQRVDKKFVGGTFSNVVSQTPAAGARVPAGGAVDLTLDEFVVVQDYVGMPLSEARRTIPTLGLVIGQKQELKAMPGKSGAIVDQQPEVGTKVPLGTPVNLKFVSDSPEPVATAVVVAPPVKATTPALTEQPDTSNQLAQALGALAGGLVQDAINKKHGQNPKSGEQPEQANSSKPNWGESAGKAVGTFVEKLFQPSRKKKQTQDQNGGTNGPSTTAVSAAAPGTRQVARR